MSDIKYVVEYKYIDDGGDANYASEPCTSRDDALVYMDELRKSPTVRRVWCAQLGTDD